MLSECGERPPVDMEENMTQKESNTPMPVKRRSTTITRDRKP